MYVGVIFFTYRNGKLPAYQVMRKIRHEFEVRELIKQIQRKQKVCSHAIAMRFDVHRYVALLSESLPSFEERHALLNTARPDVGLQVDMSRPKFRGQFEHGSQIVDHRRKALGLHDHSVRLKEPRHLLNLVAATKRQADAVVSSIDNSLDTAFDRWRNPVAMAPEHCPHGLKKLYFLHRCDQL